MATPAAGLFGLVAWAVLSTGPYTTDAGPVGPFWTIWPAWVGAGGLAVVALVAEHRAVRAVAVLLFGVATMGLLGHLEPYGVFHDSWRNVGLGQLALDPRYSEQALSNSYVAGSPLGFLTFGALSVIVPDTAALLRLFPLLVLLAYCPGIYVLALAFADAHFAGYERAGRAAPHRVRFGLMAVFAFLCIASIFSVRVNPAPQTVAFALMPFFLAAVLRGGQRRGLRLWAALLFAAIVFTHPLTAATAVLICAALLLFDRLTSWSLLVGIDGRSIGARPSRGSVVRSEAVMLYAAIFAAWVIYIGVWVVQAGSGFASRLLSALSSGETAVTSASGGGVPWDFVWVHRVAMLLAGGMVLLGLLVAWKSSRPAAARLLVWMAASAVWLPFMLLGEFGDRGPLFASLPASISIAFLLNTQLMGRRGVHLHPRLQACKALLALAVSGLAVTGFATSYPNHAGEALTEQEITGFHAISAIAQSTTDLPIFYGYMAPLTGGDLPLYLSDRLRTYAMGAADFSYERLMQKEGIVVVSDNLRQAAQLRGVRALADYDAFVARLAGSPRYTLLYSANSVRAFHVR
jgi:hypothetical protein